MTVIPLTLTDKGFEAAFKKERTGPRIRVTEFAVAAYASDYTPNSAQTALNGTVLYRGPIEDIRINERSDRIYRCLIPDTSTPGEIYEFGLYTDDNTLFAVGVMSPRYDKTNVFQLRIYAYLRVPVENASVEFEAADLPEFPSVADYSELPNANIAGPNAFVVINGHCGNTNFPKFAPLMVCKWANGDEWAIISGSLVYRGAVGSIDSDGGLWFTLPETVTPNTGADYGMVSVVDGPGRYQCRHIKYNTTLNRFDVLDKPFAAPLSTEGDTVIALWAGPGCCGGAVTSTLPSL